MLVECHSPSSDSDPQENEYAHTRAIVASLEKAPAYPVVKTFSRSDWNAKTSAQQRELFAQFNIHVHGRPGFDVLPGVTDIHSREGLSRAIKLTKRLFCHGNDDYYGISLCCLC